MSMQLSDDDLIDESQMKMTMESSVGAPHDSVSMPDPELGVEEEGNQQPNFADGEHEFRITKDRYVGAIDPVTKLRHGQGCYTYTNPYFQYQGNFENGTKSGEGVLLMRDGGKYAGMLENGEIMGQGTRTYDDGTEYIGDFVKGEKHGYGEIQYGRRNVSEVFYKGNWSMNVRQGFGQLELRNGTVFKGQFINNKPQGDSQIFFADGGSYSGEVTNGVMDGIGELKLPNGFCYAGKFENGKRHGTGRFYIKRDDMSGCAYTLEGQFKDDEATLKANEMLFELIAPVSEEEVVVDPKAKKDAKAVKKDAPFTEEEDAQYGAKKIYLECKSDVEPKEVKFNLKMVYQGPDYEDPNPPEEDEKTKKKPAGKGVVVPEEPEIRYLTPDPVPLLQESGREFAIELGQKVKFILDEKKEEAAELKTSGAEIPDEFYYTKWVRQYTDQRFKPRDINHIMSSKQQSSVEERAESMEEQKNQISARSPMGANSIDYPMPTEDMIIKIKSDAGEVNVSELSFRLDTDFRAGSYIILIKDVTPGLPPRMQMKHMRILMKLVDLDPPPEEEQVDPKAKGKPKKR